MGKWVEGEKNQTDVSLSPGVGLSNRETALCSYKGPGNLVPYAQGTHNCLKLRCRFDTSKDSLLSLEGVSVSVAVFTGRMGHLSPFS